MLTAMGVGTEAGDAEVRVRLRVRQVLLGTLAIMVGIVVGQLAVSWWVARDAPPPLTPQEQVAQDEELEAIMREADPDDVRLPYPLESTVALAFATALFAVALVVVVPGLIVLGIWWEWFGGRCVRISPVGISVRRRGSFGGRREIPWYQVLGIDEPSRRWGRHLEVQTVTDTVTLAAPMTARTPWVSWLVGDPHFDRKADAIREARARWGHPYAPPPTPGKATTPLD